MPIARNRFQGNMSDIRDLSIRGQFRGTIIAGLDRLATGKLPGCLLWCPEIWESRCGMRVSSLPNLFEVEVGESGPAAVLRHLVLARLWRAGISSCQNSAAERGSLSTASTANQSPRVQSLPMPCEKGPLSAGLSRLNWAGEPGREQRVRHLPHHFSVGGFRGQYCPAVPARTPAPPSGLVNVAQPCPAWS